MELCPVGAHRLRAETANAALCVEADVGLICELAAAAQARRVPKKRLAALRDDVAGAEEVNGDSFVVRGTQQELEKSYFRLTGAPDPASVRPEPVLERALERLLGLLRAGGESYFYALDQFKGMRQDCTVQHLRNGLTVRVYEAHARAALEYGDVPEYNQCQTQLAVLARRGPARLPRRVPGLPHPVPDRACAPGRALGAAADATQGNGTGARPRPPACLSRTGALSALCAGPCMQLIFVPCCACLLLCAAVQAHCVSGGLSGVSAGGSAPCGPACAAGQGGGGGRRFCSLFQTVRCSAQPGPCTDGHGPAPRAILSPAHSDARLSA